MTISGLAAKPVFAPAKINFFLHVTGRRDDGYHLLDTLIGFADCGDIVSAERNSEITLQIEGPFAPDLTTGDDNLVLAAAYRLAGASGVTEGARLVLEKNLPVASGIGGGSADAAAALIALQTLWSLSCDEQVLLDIGLAIGADVPVCLFGHAARVAGIGETIVPVPKLPSAGLVLANPGVAVSTAEVFRSRAGPYSDPAPDFPEWADVRAMAAALRSTRNDLWEPARTVAPVIGDVIALLEADPACLLARLSGSGATCFGLYEDDHVARRAARDIAAARPDWWVCATRILDLP